MPCCLPGEAVVSAISGDVCTPENLVSCVSRQLRPSLEPDLSFQAFPLTHTTVISGQWTYHGRRSAVPSLCATIVVWVCMRWHNIFPFQEISQVDSGPAVQVSRDPHWLQCIGLVARQAISPMQCPCREFLWAVAMLASRIATTIAWNMGLFTAPSGHSEDATLQTVSPLG